ncbi:MAG: hypothetical protein ACLQK4_16965 [Acidimicrobiales bacterium]
MFGEVAEVYDRVRPSYPVELFEIIFSYAGLTPGVPSRLCESGAGTGKASLVAGAVAAVSRWSLTCVEPDPAMAAVLGHNLASVAGLDYSIVVSGLEDFANDVDSHPPGAQRFALLFAAQSWHWVSPESRALHAAALLADGGTLALIWNVARPHPPELQKALDAAYGGAIPPREWRPQAPPQPVGSGSTVMPPSRLPSFGAVAPDRVTVPDRLDCTPRPGRVEALSGRVRREYADELEASGLFEPATVESTHWQSSHTTEEWLTLLQTHSDHRMLAENERTALLERVGLAVDAHGGTVDVDYDAVAILTKRLPR